MAGPEVHVAILAELNERKIRQAADRLEAQFGDIDAAIAVHVNEAEAKAAATKLSKQFDNIHAEVKVDVDHRGAVRGLGEVNRAIKNTEDSAKNLTGIIQELGTTAFRTSRGLATIGAPVLAVGMIELATQAVAATQALWLLPAAAAAGAAGIGTLALATSGFADTIKEVRDPEKFAAAIQSLSPAAQQAALSIQNLLPQFDALKNATQDAFFAGMGEQINRLATTYLPTIQNLTTSIATSFNNMLTGVADQLMTPQTMGALQTTFDNISQMFTNLAPTAGYLTQAFADIAAVGSDFLPGFGTEITNAAQSFANFIAQARASGELHVWIEQGVAAVRNLATALSETVQIIYRVFGPETQASIESNTVGVSALKETVQSYNADLTKTSDIIGLLTGDTETWATKWHEEMSSMQGPIAGLRDAIYDIPEAFASVVNGAIDMANKVNRVFNRMAQNATEQFSWLPGDQNFTPMPDIPHVPSGGDWRGYQGPGTGALVAPNQPNRTSRVLPGQTPMPGGPYGGPFAVPPPPPGPAGRKPSDKDRHDAFLATLDPSQYRVADPFAPMPGFPDPYAAPPGAVQGVADPLAVAEAKLNVENKAHDLEEARKNTLALQADNEASAEDILDAQHKQAVEGQDLWKAQVDLADKMRGTAKDIKDGTTELSAALDPDLGLGKGLAGLADNLVRFLGHAALAGPMAQLQQTIDQTEAATGIKGGYGLLGMRGADNLSQGLSPLLGRPMPAGTTQSGTTATSPSFLNGAMTNATTSSGVLAMPSGVDMPSILSDTGSTPSGPQSRAAAAALQQVFGSQIQGKIGGSRDSNTAPGTHDAGLSIDIPIGANQRGPGGLGDQIKQYLQDNAAALGLKYTIWHGKGTYPGGGGFTAGGHEDHVDAHFNGQGGTGGALTAGMPGAGAPSLGSGVVPVYVTNMGGMGAGGAAAALPGGAQSALTPAGQAALTGGPAGAGAERWRGAVQKVISQYGPQMGITPGNSKAWEDAIVKQIDTESKGDPTAQNPNDSNGQGGTQSVSGLLQYLPSSYANSGGKLTGRPLMDPLGQIAGALFAPRTAGGLPDTSAPGGIGAGHGWGPTSYTPKGGTAVPPNLGGGQGGGPGPYIPGITPKPPAYQDPHLDPRWSGPGIGAGLGAPSTTDLNSFGPPGGPGGSPPGSIGGIPVPAGVTAPPSGPPPGLSAGPAAAFSPSTGGPGADATKIGGLAAPESINPGGEGFGIMPGGTIDSLIQGGLQAAGGAAGPFGGGAGGAAAAAAAQTLMKLANRAIQFGGEAAGIGVSGLMETFLPTGGSELAQNNWLTRIAGAVGAAAPALPNLAGGAMGQAQQQGPLTPEQIAANGDQHGMANGAAPGPPQINITQNNNQGLTNAEQAAGAIADHQRTANAGPMGGIGVRP